MIIENMEQYSPEWWSARIGAITMSNAGALIAKGRGNAVSLTRQTYIASVASEVITGVQSDRINTWDMERGSLFEPFARQAYELYTDSEVVEIGIAFLDEKRRISASPDGFRKGFEHGLEIKCIAPKNHMNSIIKRTTDPKFMAQIQGSMWVTGYDKWDYCSFCPEFKSQPLFVMTIERDEEMIKQIEESALKAVIEVDEYVNLAQGFSSPEIDQICAEAIELTDIMQNKEPEIF